LPRAHAQVGEERVELIVGLPEVRHEVACIGDRSGVAVARKLVKGPRARGQRLVVFVTHRVRVGPGQPRFGEISAGANAAAVRATLRATLGATAMRNVSGVTTTRQRSTAAAAIVSPRSRDLLASTREARIERAIRDDLPDRLWSHKETAAFLGIPEATLHQLNYKGTGPRSFKVGRRRRYDPRDLHEWLAERSSDYFG
jgi:predicted DNA-binding transcriptional regulator AlpA